ncbi:MAG: OsmC family protein [Phycisphaerales bacterium]
MADETVRVVSTSGDGLRVEASTRLHTWVGDEHASDDLPEPAGPDPFAQLLGALGSCMTMTVRMYVERKEWALDAVRVELTGEREQAQPLERVRVQLSLEGDLDDDQRARILTISQCCPVHRTLAPTVAIETVLT